MPASNDYSKLAEECYRLANEAKTESDRQACLHLMQSWLDAASRQDSAISEHRAEAQTSERTSDVKLSRRKGSTKWRHRLFGLFR